MRLIKAVSTVSGWTLLSRVLGLLRDRLLGATFGAGLLLDSFFVAFALPNMLRNLFGEGALASAFVPRYVRERQSDEVAAEHFAGLVATRLALFLSGLSILGFMSLAILLRSGIGSLEESPFLLVLVLLIPQLPYAIFICMAALLAGILQARRAFMVPAAAPVLLNVVLIVTVLCFGSDIYYLPYAVLVAGIAQCFAHVWACRQSSPNKTMPPLSFRSTPALRELRIALIPSLVAAGIYQVNVLLDSVIAFVFLPATGAVTILYFANRLLQFPMALVTHGVGTALYPHISESAIDGYTASGEAVQKAQRSILCLLLPASAGLALCSEDLIHLIFETGAFDAEAARRTFFVCLIFAAFLLPASLNKLFVREFLAHKDQKTPMYCSILAVMLNLILNIILVQTTLREAGLALASLMSSLVLLVIYALILASRGSSSAKFWRGSLRPVLATLGMSVVVYGFYRFIAEDFHVLVRVGMIIPIAMLIYVMLALPSLKEMWKARA